MRSRAGPASVHRAEEDLDASRGFRSPPDRIGRENGVSLAPREATQGHADMRRGPETKGALDGGVRLRGQP
jgi:hypothetical protein